MKNDFQYYKNIIVGAGAAGLFCAANMDVKWDEDNETSARVIQTSREDTTVILEKTAKPGTKLLMAGGGQCNVTHGGSIKDFITRYGDKGKKIRGVLQRHNNIELCNFMERMGVPLTEREDGKIFPRSLRGRDVLGALLEETRRKNIAIRCNEEVLTIERLGERGGKDAGELCNPGDYGRFKITTAGNTFICENLIMATGGCSYPSTGSDGSMISIIERDLGLKIVTPVPSLTPVFVENYPFGELSGISFKEVGLTVFDSKDRKVFQAYGDILLTEKNLSGPVIINSSRYMTAGMKLSVNFLGKRRPEDIEESCKRDFPGNSKAPQTYLTEDLKLPKRFAQTMVDTVGISARKVSQMTGKEIRALVLAVTAHTFTISGVAGFKEAMATAGGVSLEEINTSTMEAKNIPGLYLIGEMVDVDGDTGGYNLQFAYSSAKAAAENIGKGQK